MRFGLIGLGKMGSHLALHALEKGHEVVGYDPHPQAAAALAQPRFFAAEDLRDLAAKLSPPRVALVYVPHGAATDSVLSALAKGFSPGDVVADGGNSHWRDSQRHHRELAASGVHFLDVGTSGGLEGARHGACFMLGGDAEAFTLIAPLLAHLAVADGVLHAGPAGAGHFVKLIHNAIEFGMLQAIGEGVDLLERSEFPLDLAAVFHNWAHGSVIRGWLVELMERGLREHRLDQLSSYVEDTREVKWAVEYALEKEAWIPVIAQAELALYRYRDPDSRAGRAVALMRHGFGGHPLHRKTAPPAGVPDAA